MRWGSQYIWFVSWLLIIKDVSAIVGSQNSCYYRQYLEPGQLVFVSSIGYPNFTPYAPCQWEIYTGEGAIIKTLCDYLGALDYSGPCNDYLRLTTKGVTTTHCSPFSIFGDSSVKLSLKPSNTQMGRFRCVVVADQPTPQPTSTPQPTTTSPNVKCDCGWSKQATRLRIVGGEEANINEFPSMIVFVHIKTRTMWCGGTIITRNAVLTAAHCTYEQTPTDYAVLIGEHDITKLHETSETTLARVHKFITHPKYDHITQANDIALAVTSAIQFTDNVGPVCLPFNFITPTYTYVTVAGWGLDSFGGSKSNVLMKTNLRIIPPNYCVKTYDYYDPNNQMCTYLKGKDACQYDSGGPLYVNNDEGKQFLVGIISHGKNCGQMYPAVNTRLTSHLDWIQSALPGEGFCKKY